MDGRPLFSRIGRALGLLFLVCLVIRICWVLVQPLLAPLGVMVLLLGLGYLLLRGPKFRG